MTTIVAWVAVFGILIAVHELGHFLMAKGLGMRVNEYSLGFGPSLIKQRWGETIYALRIIPLGGYVRLAGMEGNKTDDSREYPNRPLWQRFIVVFAGPVMNLALAAVLYAILFGPVGVPTPTTTVAKSIPHYPAYSAGIRAGDKIAKVDGRRIKNWTELEKAIQAHVHQPMRITVIRHHTAHTLTVRTRYDSLTHTNIVGIQPVMVPVHQNPAHAVVSGVKQTVALTGAWFGALFRLVEGHSHHFDVTGPVGIAVLVGKAAQEGWAYLLLLSAGLSANLGLFNVLPIPVLDGSRLFLMGIEGVRRKAMDPERESMIHLIGFVVLLLFVVFVTYHDIVHYFHVKAPL